MTLIHFNQLELDKSIYDSKPYRFLSTSGGNGVARNPLLILTSIKEPNSEFNKTR